jgi:hypothetical protein
MCCLTKNEFYGKKLKKKKDNIISSLNLKQDLESLKKKKKIKIKILLVNSYF